MVLEEHVAIPEVKFGVRLLIQYGCAEGLEKLWVAAVPSVTQERLCSTQEATS